MLAGTHTCRLDGQQTHLRRASRMRRALPAAAWAVHRHAGEPLVHLARLGGAVGLGQDPRPVLQHNSLQSLHHAGHAAATEHYWQ